MEEVKSILIWNLLFQITFFNLNAAWCCIFSSIMLYSTQTFMKRTVNIANAIKEILEWTLF